ncbi:MAG: hypothetical protein QOG54_94 [Actinomycetota bacterium]|jgi:glyoxylase-like metal-dependent hydrolase (beta-lactamase superfamily II)|nr:hypothetical protein [Actinomycetota bacterium]
MLIESVAKGIHQVTDSFVNWYLVEDGDRLTVVDAGIRSSWKSLHAALAQLGRIPESIDAIVLTHAHPDHTGFAEKARVQLGVPVFVHEADEMISRHPLRYKHERSLLPYAFNPKALPVVASFIRTGSFLLSPIRSVETFGDEGVLDVPGSPRIIPTPGHTFGHTAFHFEDRDALIVGDSIATWNPYSGKTGPQLMPLCSTADGNEAIRSLSAIAATEASTLLVGHGDPWAQGAASAAAQARSIGLS